MSEAVIELRGIHKFFGEGSARLHVLKGIDLTVRTGEYVSITGQSGSGKSTLLNLLGCLDRPTEGSYLLDGRDVSTIGDDELSEKRNQDIGFIFQSFNLIPQLTVLENVAVPRLYHPHDGASSEARCRELLDAVGLSHRLGHLPNQLSGGERQRVAIARALVNDPVMLLADEPTGNLDTATGEDVLALMHELHAQGRTIVMITHDEEIARGAGRQVHIRDGVILEEAAA
ncbi:MAG: ABC transporter ATP-binding protein [Planctomycetota bacterium]